MCVDDSIGIGVSFNSLGFPPHLISMGKKDHRGNANGRNSRQSRAAVDSECRHPGRADEVEVDVGDESSGEEPTGEPRTISVKLLMWEFGQNDPKRYGTVSRIFEFGSTVYVFRCALMADTEIVAASYED